MLKMVRTHPDSEWNYFPRRLISYLLVLVRKNWRGRKAETQPPIGIRVIYTQSPYVTQTHPTEMRSGGNYDQAPYVGNT